MALLAVTQEFRFVMSNIIDDAHFGPDGREEKNPSAQDLIARWGQFERRAKKTGAHCIVAFGANVRTAFAEIDGIKYVDGHVYHRGNQKVVFSPHPSFIMVYRRRKIDDYISALSFLISKNATFGQDLRDA
jgi:hypothetical protein